MAQKKVGYVKLEWVCPNCNTRNPGPQKTCTSCGAPQPDNVQFQRAVDEKIITDADAIKRASAGADIHCGYCGTRNPGDAKECKQCGADLSEGTRRAAGQKIEGYSGPKEIACSNCGEMNPAANLKCSKCVSPLARASAPTSAASPQVNIQQQMAQAFKPGGAKLGMDNTLKKNSKLIIGVIAFLLLCCCGIGALYFFPTSSATGTVDSVQWQTTIDVQEEREVHHSNESSAPGGAYNVSCSDTNEEVCTEHTVDQGNGYAEVVQDCHTETKTSCSYDIMEWTTIQSYPMEGNDFNPTFADPFIEAGQQLGNEKTTYTVFFSTDDGIVEYTPNTYEEFLQFQSGGEWLLKTNVFGGITSVERK